MVAVSQRTGSPVSQTTYSRLSVPVKLESGVYSIVPSGLIVTEPLVGGVMIATELVSNGPSTSKSPSNGSTTTGVSSVVVAESVSATGGSFTGVISM